MHQMCLTKQALSVGIGRAQVITRTSSDEKIKRAPFINLKDRIKTVSSRLQMYLITEKQKVEKNDFVTVHVFS